MVVIANCELSILDDCAMLIQLSDDMCVCVVCSLRGKCVTRLAGLAGTTVQPSLLLGTLKIMNKEGFWSAMSRLSVKNLLYAE